MIINDTNEPSTEKTPKKLKKMWLFGFSSSKNVWIYVPILVIALLIYMLKLWAMMCFDHDAKKAIKNGESRGEGDARMKNMYEEVSSTKSGTMSWSFYCCSTSNGVVKTYTLEELKAATRDFRFRIGVGATSFVYLAELGDGRYGAVKRVMVDRGGSKKMFLDEVLVLLRLSHPNLVGLLGFCLEKGEQILLLEYVPNKSLFDRMHTNHGQSLGVLTWSNRVSIALDIARALDYLHTRADPQIIHRDVKSSNVLLIDDNHAKLADFGLCKVGHNNKENSMMIKGTFGYADTNYVKTGLVSTKSDVYSYGVFLLELITGLKSVQGLITLVEWTKESRKKVGDDDSEASVKALLDPKLNDAANMEQCKALIDVANAALVEESEARPEMSYIVDRISSLGTEFILQPPQELSLKVVV